MTIIKVKLSSDQSLQFQPAEQSGKRQFSGIANSGKVFGYGATQMVVDFTNIQIKTKTAVLIEHNPYKAAGVATLSVDTISGCLKADGILMDNEHGRFIAELADNGFPWEMSIHVDSARCEEVSAGNIVVNGNAITAPVVVMRDCVVREVSFTAVGVDGQTNAIVLSDGIPATFNPQKSENSEEKANTMTPEEQAKMDALEQENNDLKKEINELKKAQKAEKMKAKLSAAGFKADDKGNFDGVSAPMMTALLSASDADADAMIADLAVKLSANNSEPKKPDVPAVLLAGLSNPPANNTNASARLSATATLTNARGQTYV